MSTEKTVLVPLAEGFEEIEAVTIIDVLRRAGADVTVAGQSSGPLRASRGVLVKPEVTFKKIKDQEFSLIALPGGMPGAKNLAEDEIIHALLERAVSQKAWIAAICAAPAVVLQKHGLIEGKKATCHANFKDELPSYVDEPVVVDGRLVTSQAPGTSMAFALKLVELLFGEVKANQVAGPMAFKPPQS